MSAEDNHQMTVQDGSGKHNGKRRYSTQRFYEDMNSDKPSHAKAIVNGVAAGLKVFVKESPHPMTKIINSTMRKIFSD